MVHDQRGQEGPSGLKPRGAEGRGNKTGEERSEGQSGMKAKRKEERRGENRGQEEETGDDEKDAHGFGVALPPLG